jgi:plasmid maintenance system killer protein
VKHITHASFWEHYRRLPSEIQRQADRKFKLLQTSPENPSLRFKRIRDLWSVRVTQDYRALAIETERGLAWFWIGPHAEYDRLLRR